MVEIIRVRDEGEMKQVREIWTAVFADEQGSSAGLETDEPDAGAVHVLSFVDGVPAGCARMLFCGDEVQIGRVAVMKNMRLSGIGTGMCKLLITLAREQGITKFSVVTQLPAVKFYNTLGFQTEGEPFGEADIRTVKMVKKC